MDGRVAFTIAMGFAIVVGVYVTLKWPTSKSTKGVDVNTSDSSIPLPPGNQGYMWEHDCKDGYNKRVKPKREWL